MTELVMSAEAALVIGFLFGGMVVYIPMRILTARLERRIHQLIKARNFATLEKYMKQLEGGG